MDGIIYLIRHGMAEGDEKRRYKGSLDVPLSQEGAGQVRRTAAFLKGSLGRAGLEPRALYCSRLKRAHLSADIIGQALGLKPQVKEPLRERDFGAWEGMTFDEIGHAYPDDFGAWAGDPLNFSPIGGESTLEVRDRVMPVVTEIGRGLDGDAVVVVAHGGVNRIVLAELMGLSLANIFRIEQDNACLNIIEFHDGFPVLRLINRAPEADD